MDPELQRLIEEAAAGKPDRWAIYGHLQTDFRYAARLGVRSMKVYEQDLVDEAVEDAVLIALQEFMRQDFTTMTSPDGLARSISYRRGQDQGRAIQARLKRERAVDGVTLEAIAAETAAWNPNPVNPEEEFLDQEEIAQRLELWKLAMECLGEMNEQRRRILQETLQKGRTLTEVGEELGVSHTTVGNHRDAGLKLLLECIERKRATGDHQDEWEGGK